MDYLPTTKKEMRQLGWQQLDVILITGDTLIDSPYIGVSLLGRLLVDEGFRVGIIAQPKINTDIDICRLGEPLLFWGVSGGSIDSMVANYTATKKWRKTDDFTPGTINNRRPDRAVIAYTNLIKRYFKNTKPIVIGGIEASLRRIAHYDYWDNRIRKSILFDAKADMLIYGMAEKAIVQLANALQSSLDFKKIRGLCYASKSIPNNYIELPSFEIVSKDSKAFTAMFETFYNNNEPLTAKGLAQKQDNRFLIQNPPSPYMSQAELDAIYELPFNRSVHPFYAKLGSVRAQDTIQFSITTHRGCYGECNFCAIAVHQGLTIRNRSQQSIINEAKKLTKHPNFKGYILDVGGPTANMYGFECKKKISKGPCHNKKCLQPTVCPTLKINHHKQTTLLKKLRNIKGVKKAFVASGIRYDLIQKDPKGKEYLKELIKHNVSGQMKVAPEHSENHVLSTMGKPGTESLLQFKQAFDQITKSCGKNQFLTYYFIAAHPGCTAKHMKLLKTFCHQQLQTSPEQIQIFTPTPSTYSTIMYWTETNPFTGENLYVEKNTKAKEQQKRIITKKKNQIDSKKRLKRKYNY